MQWKPHTSQTTLDEFKRDLNKATGQTIEYKVVGNGDTTTTEKITHVLNIVFNVIITLTMFLCFFALSANMSANLYQQTKEIGVLRSIGVTSNRIKLLYFYEAMVLVLSSCTMGIGVGTFVSYTFALQQALVMHVPATVFFPWQ